MDRVTVTIIDHIKTRAIVVEILIVGAAWWLLHLQGQSAGFRQFNFALAVTGTLLAATVAFRRTTSPRHIRDLADIERHDQRFRYLLGEMLGCFALTVALLAVYLIGAGIIMGPGATGDAESLFFALTMTLLCAAMSIPIVFVFSPLCIPYEAASVISVALLILGSARSQVIRDIHARLDGDWTEAIIKTVTPPLEELIKLAIGSHIAAPGLYLAQALLYTVAMIVIAVVVFNARDLEKLRLEKPK